MSLKRIIELWEKATPKTAEESLREADALAGKLKGAEFTEAQGYLEGLAMLIVSTRMH